MVENLQDIKWLKNFEIYKDYVTKHGKLPQSAEVWGGILIGSWLRNQRKRHTEGKLKQERVSLLDNFNNMWKSDTADIKISRLKVETLKLLKQNESARSAGKTPLASMEGAPEDLIVRALGKGITYCEQILNAKDSSNYKIFLSDTGKIKLLAASAIYKTISKPTILLMVYMTGSYTALSTRVNMQDLESKVHDAIEELPYRESRLIKMHFGYAGGSPRELRICGDDLGISPVRANQILHRAIRELKRINRSKKMINWD